jgi:hypothetical protein
MNKKILFIICSFLLTSCSAVEVGALETGALETVEKVIELEEEKVKQEK